MREVNRENGAMTSAGGVFDEGAQRFEGDEQGAV